jgi:hypothetical protein
MEDIIKIQIDAGSAVTELETIETAMQNVDTATQHTEEATKSLKTQIREATNELHNMAEDDPRRAKLIADIGNMRDRMADSAEQIRQQTGPAVEGLNNSFGIMRDQMMNLDFAGLATSMQGVATNIGRINTAEFVAGLKSILAAGVDVFTQLGKVIMANPLLMIVGIVTAIIATFDKWKSRFPAIEKAITGINEEERKGLKIAEQKVAASSKAYENIQKTENILKLQGKSEREILQMKMEALKVDIANRKTQLAIIEKQAITQIETAKRNKEIVMGIVGFLTAPLQLILYTVDQIASFAGVATNLQKDFNDFAASFVVDPIEMETELNKTIQENKDAIRDMENEYAGLQISIKNMDKQALEEKKKINQEKKKEAKKDKEEEIKEEVDKNEKLKAEEEKKERAQKKLEFERQMAAALEELQEANYQAGLSDKARELEAVQYHYQDMIRELERHGQDATNLKEEQRKKEDEINKKYNDKELADARTLQEAKLDMISKGLKAFADVTMSFDIKNEKRAKKQFQINKALTMAAALIDTYKAVTSALADPNPLIPYNMKMANAVIAGATGFAQVAKIAQTQYNTTGGTQGGTGGMDTGGGTGGGGMQAPPIDFSFMQQTGQPNTVETYVLAGNVANALEARQKIIDQSHL